MAYEPVLLARMNKPDSGKLEGYRADGGYAAAKAPPPFFAHVVPDSKLAPFLKTDPGVILTDQYAPVDNLMAEVFRRRND